MIPNGQTGSEGAEFRSILFPGPQDGSAAVSRDAPPFFRDLNLDQIIDAVVAAWKDYDLAPFFRTGPVDLETISYRQDVMRDLEDTALRRAIDSFSDGMREMRRRLEQANKRYYRREKERWFLEAVDLYGDTVGRLHQDLLGLDPVSPGMRAFRDYLTKHVASSAFRARAAETRRLKSELASIKYNVQIRGLAVTVRPYDAETDYCAAVEATFEKFRRGAATDYRVQFAASPGMNHVEAEILEGVAKLHPGAFRALEAYRSEHEDFVDATISRFDREIHFYIAYLDHLRKFRQAGLTFCYPQILTATKDIRAREAFDLALAGKLVGEKKAVVVNDFSLSGPERLFVVSGPNQSGKTTFARMFGQLHYLANLGCPVPGRQARLYHFDRMFTHFESGEDFENLRGKLESDLIRIREILDRATPDSLMIVNEIFSSTTLKDAMFLSRKVMARFSALDVLGVCVTFLTELASFDEKTVSLVGGVDSGDPSVRTFKLERKAADGLAYALTIAEKYRLTHGRLIERFER